MYYGENYGSAIYSTILDNVVGERKHILLPSGKTIQDIQADSTRSDMIEIVKEYK